MVFLALTRTGFDGLMSLLGHAPSPLWVNAEILSPEELARLRSEGVEVTNFTYLIPVEDPEAIASAVAMVAEHHPHRVIWVEHAPGL
jgi:hypothetical protein